MADEKRLYPFQFVPKQEQRPWGTRTLKLADLGTVDTMVERGWLGGNPLSDLMQTYLERVVGDEAFGRYGTQFPVSVEVLDVQGRTSLQAGVDDRSAEQRYDAFGRTALWYVAEAGPGAVVYQGFERDVTAAELYAACADGSVGSLLHAIHPQKGDCFLMPPGVVHAAQGPLKLIVISEASDLCFRLHDWDNGRETELEEAFDLIDLGAFNPALHRRMHPGAASEKLFATEQFTVTEFRLGNPVRVEAEKSDSFLVYTCVGGAASFQLPSEDGKGLDTYALKAGGVLLIPAEIPDFSIVPTAPDTVLLETMLEPQREVDAYINPDAEPYLDGEDYNGLEGEDFTDWAGPHIVN